jgi:nucleolysin TIA-1/TIAR
MADQPPPPPGAPIVSSGTTGAPGTGGYEGAPGQPNTHMPPPPIPPLSIPQNTNPIPTAISSPMNNGHRMASPQSAGLVRRAAPELNKRNLYVGGLDQQINEQVLKQIFETAGHVVSVKVIPEKSSQGLNYGFIEFDDPAAAENAMSTLNGRKIHGKEIRVNWAYHPNNENKEDTSTHHHIFVGDLSNEVNNETLQRAFSAFGEISEARVMWDMKTGRSRGFGFVAYRLREHAEKAISSMDGEWLGSRAIRVNWANQKGQPSIAQQQAMVQMGMPPPMPFNHPPFPTNGMQSYQQVLEQSPSWQTTCYCGNLTPYTSQNDLVPLFKNFGEVLECRMAADRGFAFMKMESHAAAATAICKLNGYMVNGRPMKCSWGKDRPATMTFDPATSPYSPFSPQQPTPGAPPSAGYPNSGYPQSGYPQSAGSYGHGQFQQYGGPMASPGAGGPMGGPMGGQMHSPQGGMPGGQPPQNYGGPPPPGPYPGPPQHPASAGAYPPQQGGQWQPGGGYPQNFGYQG